MRRALPWLAVGLLTLLAVALRWQTLPAASALGDAMGPWWVAARGSPFATPHAPPYGWLLAATYTPLLAGAGSLWQAVSGLMVLHALAAPVTVWVLRRCGAGWPPALLAGLAASVDRGLLDTATSGAETYLAPVFIGLTAAAVAGPRPRPLLAGTSLAMAVHHHPLSLCAVPLLLLLPRQKASVWVLLPLAVLLVPHLAQLVDHPTGLGGGSTAAPLVALDAWRLQLGPQAYLVGGALLLALVRPTTRRLGLATLASLLLLLLAGAGMGMLRDHHLRLLVIPALAGLATLRGPWALLGLLLLRPPIDPVTHESHTRRPGTHGLLSQVTTAVASTGASPLIVDGVWISGVPAAEAGAVMLDLHLRGRDDIDLGGQIALIISAERKDLPTIEELTEVHRGDRHRVVRGSEEQVATWLGDHCAERFAEGAPLPRLGGAFDGLAILAPGVPASRLEAWTGACTAQQDTPEVSAAHVEGGCPPGMVQLGGHGILGLPEGTYAVVETADRVEVRQPLSECPAALEAAPEALACWVQTDLVDPVLRPRPVELDQFCVEAHPFPGAGVPYTVDGMTAWDAARLDELLQTGRYGPRRLCMASEVEAAAAGLVGNAPFISADAADPGRCPVELVAEDGTLSAPLIGHDPDCRNDETGVHEVGAVVSHWAIADRAFVAAACESPPCRGAGNNLLTAGHYVVMGGTGRLQTRQAPLTPHTWHDHGRPVATGCDRMGHDDQPLICATPDPAYANGEVDAEAEAAWAQLVAIARDTGRMSAVLETGLGRPVCPED